MEYMYSPKLCNALSGYSGGPQTTSLSTGRTFPTNQLRARGPIICAQLLRSLGFVFLLPFSGRILLQQGRTLTGMILLSPKMTRRGVFDQPYWGREHKISATLNPK